LVLIQVDIPRSMRSAGVLLVLSLIVAALVAGCGPLGESDPTPEPTATPAPTATPIPTPTPEPTPTATPEPTATPIPEPTPSPTPVPVTGDYSFQIITSFPHDRQAFTQGLEFHDGYIYESTGLRGESTLRRVNLETGEVLQLHELEDHLFGEGLTILDDRIYQLTWQAGVGFVYDLDSFEQLSEFSYEGEGWGLANDGERLIMSDGSNVITFRDPETFEILEEITVYDDRGPVMMLNELEWIDGEIWSNIWRDDIIVVIDPETGWVTQRIDLTGLLQDEHRGEHRVDVLNGIAWDPHGERLIVTGKLWPVMYQIEVIPLEDE
jgi:glutaminyl-peptide cyclotransferase